MTKLSTVAVNDLYEALERVLTGKAAKRLIIALAYKDGVSVATLSERYDIPRSTVYYWLDRFEELPIDEAIRDDDRPGRPSELSPGERENLKEELDDSPDLLGYDEQYGAAEVVQYHISQEYGVTYSKGHVRPLLRTFDADVRDAKHPK